MTENNERLTKASTTLATMLDYLGLNASVKGEEKNGKFVLNASSDDAGRIIGKKGQSLQSLELLLNRMATKNDIDCPWISIDVDGYSKGNNAHHAKGGPKRKNNFNGRKKGNFSDKKRFSSSKKPENIKQQTLDAAKEVKRWGEAVTLPPMNSHDRRIVHMTLKEDKEITTESIEVSGSDRLKSVVISLLEKSN